MRRSDLVIQTGNLGTLMEVVHYGCGLFPQGMGHGNQIVVETVESVDGLLLVTTLDGEQFNCSRSDLYMAPLGAEALERKALWLRAHYYRVDGATAKARRASAGHWVYESRFGGRLSVIRRALSRMLARL